MVTHWNDGDGLNWIRSACLAKWRRWNELGSNCVPRGRTGTEWIGFDLSVGRPDQKTTSQHKHSRQLIVAFGKKGDQDNIARSSSLSGCYHRLHPYWLKGGGGGGRWGYCGYDLILNHGIFEWVVLDGNSRSPVRVVSGQDTFTQNTDKCESLFVTKW